MRPQILPLLLLLCTGCAVQSPIVHYQIATKNRLSCCRSMQFETAEFPATLPARGNDTGLVIRLESEQISGDCARGAEVPLRIANHSGRDLYIPFSHDLEGSRVKLYPWRLLVDSASHSMRVARQIQYGDLLERQNSRLRFVRLPAGREVLLTGWIAPDWLCTPPTEMYEGYLQAELDPAFYAQRSRGLRTLPHQQAPDLESPIGLRYDVVYTDLEFLEYLPATSRRWSEGRDSTVIEYDVTEEPAEFVNASQRVAESNIVQLLIDRPEPKKGSPDPE